jgi:hypothetical protein
MKINEFMTKDGWLREDGRVTMHLEEVKSPAESKYPFDYFKFLATIPADQAFRTLKENGCSLVPAEPQRKRPRAAGSAPAAPFVRSLGGGTAGLVPVDAASDPHVPPKQTVYGPGDRRGSPT